MHTQRKSCVWPQCAPSAWAGCAWACALVVAVAGDALADVDTSTGLGDNTLTNSGKLKPFLLYKSLETY